MATFLSRLLTDTLRRSLKAVVLPVIYLPIQANLCACIFVTCGLTFRVMFAVIRYAYVCVFSMSRIEEHFDTSEPKTNPPSFVVYV